MPLFRWNIDVQIWHVCRPYERVVWKWVKDSGVWQIINVMIVVETRQHIAVIDGQWTVTIIQIIMRKMAYKLDDAAYSLFEIMYRIITEGIPIFQIMKCMGKQRQEQVKILRYFEHLTVGHIWAISVNERGTFQGKQYLTITAPV